MSQALNKIQEYSQKGAELRVRFFDENAELVEAASRAMALCLASGGKILICGNGGSAADSQHIAAELVNRFLMERPPLPAIALTTDTSILTAIGNDYGYEQVFEKQVAALGNPGDILIGISTSGNSGNVVRALKTARDKGLVTVGLTGKSGGEMTSLCEYLLSVPTSHTPLIQEIHITAGHLFCDLIDHYLFEAVAELAPYLDQTE